MSASPAIEGWFTTGRGAGAARVAVHDLRDGLLPADPSPAGFCRNPACDGEEFETVELSRRGTVWSYTDAQYQPPPPYVAAHRPVRAVRARRGRAARGPHRARPGRRRLRRRRPAGSAPRSSWWSRRCYADDDAATADLALEAGHRAGRGGRPVSSTTSPSSAWACTRGASGAGRSPSTACTRPGPRSPTPASPGPTSTSWSAARPCATATAATSPARPSRRRSAGTAPGSPRRTPPAPPAPRPSTPRAPGSWPGCARSRSSSAPTPRPKGFLAPNAGERWDDPDWLRFRLLGMTNPAYFALYARRRMDLYGATPEDFAAGQGQERPARAGQPERPLPQGGQRRGRPRQRRWSPTRCTCSTSARPPTVPRRSCSRATEYAARHGPRPAGARSARSRP